MYLGRYQQGYEIPVTLRTAGAARSPSWPSVRPRMQVVRNSDGASRTNVEMASYLPGVQDGSFRATIFLGTLFDLAGSYSVICRWVDSGGNPWQQVDTFELVGGGNPAGTVFGLTQVLRPDANYLLESTDGGYILRRKNPR